MRETARLEIEMEHLEIALKLAAGETVNNKDIKDIKAILRSMVAIRHNCDTVIKQLRKHLKR